MGVEHSESGNAFFDGDVVFLGDGDVLIHVTDVDVDEDEVFGEEFCVGALVVVDVEDLAVATPVAAEVEEDTFVLAPCPGDSDRDVSCSVGGLGVEVWVGFEEPGLAMDVSRGREAKGSNEGSSNGKEIGMELR